MSSHRSLLRGGCLGLVVVSVAFQAAWAETVAQKKVRSAAQAVEQALSNEVQGGDRSTLMQDALRELPSYAPARWQTGHVQIGQTWVKFDDTAELAKQNARLNGYLAARDRVMATAEGQLTLAKWCAAHRLYDQMRAHLTQVLAQSPDNREARRMLGDWYVNGRWISAEEADRFADRTGSDADSLARWSAKIRKLCGDLSHRTVLRQRAAAERLRAIDDPTAIAALEEIPFTHSEAAAQVAVEALSPMTEPRAAKALTRYAVHSPWESVRREAAASLRSRDMDSYVPQLLSALSTPLVASAQIQSVPGGYLVHALQYTRERQYHEEVAAADTAAVFLLQNPPTRGARAPGTITDPQASATGLVQTAIAPENVAIAVTNTRIMDTLSAATGQRGLTTPAEWWKWWNDHNEVVLPSSKPVRGLDTVAATMFVRNEMRLPDILEQPDTAPAPASSLSTYRPAIYECLVAGTPVWTDRGPAAVERIRVGDRVLSQDLESGRLDFKPVLSTTVRPPTELTRIELAGETLRTSGGHPFWVNGEGWVKARDLKPGTRLHTVRDVVTVDTVRTDSREQTFNLIAADNHNYFAGNHGVLTHDNTIRRATGVGVPGFKRQSTSDRPLASKK